MYLHRIEILQVVLCIKYQEVCGVRFSSYYDGADEATGNLYYCLRRRLASGEGTVSLGVRLSPCHSVCVSAALVTLGDEGNALYLVLSGF